MAKVRRANVVLEIKDDQLERFVDMGYDVIGDNGVVIKKSIPKDIGTLTKAYMDHTAEIEKLKAEIAKLKAAAKVKKPEVRVEEPEQKVEEPKPKSTNKKSTKKSA